MKLANAVLCPVLFIPSLALADYSAHVIAIIDGDTIEVLHENKIERIRLNGIDCPEKGQAFGQKAKQATSGLVFGKQVTIQTHGKDRHGRTIADVLLPDGTNINYIFVKEGWCWWYQKYAPDNVILSELQRRARRSGLTKYGPSWLGLEERRRRCLARRGQNK